MCVYCPGSHPEGDGSVPPPKLSSSPHSYISWALLIAVRASQSACPSFMYILLTEGARALVRGTDSITAKGSSHSHSLSWYPAPQFPQGHVTRGQCSPACVGGGTTGGEP